MVWVSALRNCVSCSAMVGQLTKDNLPSSGKHLRLKADHRLSRNFYKGVKGDAINVLLAAAAYNFKRAMRVLLYLIKRRGCVKTKNSEKLLFILTVSLPHKY